MAHFSPLLHLTSARPWLLAVLLLLAAPLVRAQVPSWGGAAVGSTQPNGTSEIRAVATDASGNVFVAGSFTGEVDFGSTRLASAGGTDLFVAKYVPATGTWAWAQRGGGTSNDQGTGLAVSGTSVYVSGFYNNNATNTNAVRFGGTNPATSPTQVSGASATASNDLLLAKYTDNGATATLGWMQVGGGAGNDQGTGVAVSGTSVYVAGFITNTTGDINSVRFGGNGTTPGTSGQVGAVASGYASNIPATPDLLLAKYLDNGATGTYQWSQVGGGTDYDYGRGVAVSGSSVYLIGDLANSTGNIRQVVFGGGGTTAGTIQVNGNSAIVRGDLVLAKYTDNGATATLGWTQVGGGNMSDTYATAVAASGASVYVTGYLYNNAGNSNAIVFGGGGTTPGTVPVSGATTALSNDLVLAKYTDQGSTGTLTWTQVGGGTGNDYGYGVAVSGTSVYVTGQLYNSTSNASGALFGGSGTTPGTVPVSGASSMASPDLVLAKYTDNGSTATLSWAQVGGGTGVDYGRSGAVSGQRVYAGGAAVPAATFGPTTLTTPAGSSTAVLAYLTDLTVLATHPAATTGPAGLTLYPNPTRHGAATLTGTTPGTAVQVLDALGRLVRTATADATGTAALTGLPAGLYLVRADTGAVRLSVE